MFSLTRGIDFYTSLMFITDLQYDRFAKLVTHLPKNLERTKAISRSKKFLIYNRVHWPVHDYRTYVTSRRRNTCDMLHKHRSTCGRRWDPDYYSAPSRQITTKSVLLAAKQPLHPVFRIVFISIEEYFFRLSKVNKLITVYPVLFMAKNLYL
ncbi:unnamed protein product [Amoebophrya sp. A25]|nr:unnamed protein product [Amoebophrya sp. A25]|eukprot:GSA25T00013290001.1